MTHTLRFDRATRALLSHTVEGKAAGVRIWWEDGDLKAVTTDGSQRTITVEQTFPEEGVTEMRVFVADKRRGIR